MHRGEPLRTVRMACFRASLVLHLDRGIVPGLHLMRNFDVRIFDPPNVFLTGEADKPGVVLRPMPVAALFAAKGTPTEICRIYGYLMLLGQNLEFELRECLTSMQCSFALRGIKPRFTGKPEKAKFDKLIEMLAAQLNTKHPSTRKFVDELHRARKLRNRLAHGFLHPAEGEYYISHGGQQAILHRLKLAEAIFFPIIMFIGHLAHAYAADFGLTAEYAERLRKAEEAEQRQIEEDFKDIFDDD